MNTPQMENPFQGIEIKEIVPKKVNPGIKKIKRLLKYLNAEGVKYRVTGDDDIELRIKSREVEIKPFDQVWIRLDSVTVDLHWFKEGDRYLVNLIFIIEDYDMFLNEYDKFYEIELKGKFEIEIKKSTVTIRLWAIKDVEISYYDDYSV